ncbi:PIEZO-TYPE MECHANOSENSITIVE ION CHANNEL-like protein [Salix koriyanagi]|uniref:PIEZO-TYPE MECHANOSENSITIVE ION CHANNEL-like protein n=1 Tax=Salix koriyanagi TaxID=2511006 RepID=A0A9Q0Z6V7_9ROSI|nr:PIEZO-TYPE MECHANOSENSITIVE ION CHANNEL-like protein [Salix koriyanagi]
MGNFLVGFVLPFLLLTSSLINWSLISLVDVIAFLLIQYAAPKIGYRFQRRLFLLWFIIIFSLVVILSQAVYLVIWGILGDKWSGTDAWWAHLIGFMIIHSWKSPLVIYFLVIQLLAVFVALVDVYWSRFGLVPWQDSCWGHFLNLLEHLGSHLRVASCLLLPAIQLIVGISHPSWLSLPFFIASCAGLVDWSLTSNFLGLFRWWRPLQLYASVNIILLYTYQLPMEFLSTFQWVADFIGLFKISGKSEWLKICSSASLVLFYIMLSFIKCDLEEMDFIMSMRGSTLTEQLLPLRHSFFIRKSRSGVRHTNVLLRGAVFRTFSINFFTYGFPVSLFALSYWSLHFASICAFGLLAYVGYIAYAFPSVFRLHRLNGLLLVFILFWAVSTYIFNVAFPLLSWKLGKDMAIWDMVGLWHYPLPGLFLLAQFCLGILVALGNLVNNSVFLYLSDEGNGSSNDNSTVQEEEDTKVLIVATIAWGLRKCSRAIMLVLIFLIATKPGIIHAVYLIFFLIYLLSHNISRKIRQPLILLCEVHFAMLYILEINLISLALERKGSLTMEVLLQLGLLKHHSSWDFLKIALLACFCAIHNHGFEMLFSFSAIVQHTPRPPFGFSILKAGLNKSVLLSVYASSTTRYGHGNSSHESRIALFLGAIGQKFLSTYRSCGTYIAFLTILLAVAFGFVYLLGLLVFSTLPKASRIPSKSFLLYTGFLVTTEYLFQMWGRQAEMFPGQKHSELSLFLGFRAYKPGFWGLESGLRAKVLVIAACTLQYNVFRWLDKMPSICQNKGKWEEPCPLFVSDEDAFMNGSMASDENKPPPYHRIPSVKGEGFIRSSQTSITAGLTQAPDLVSNKTGGAEGSGTSKFSFGYIWGSTNESHKWNKKGILSLKKERLETQKIVLKVYLKFWIENMFNLFGLEINMIALLLASFALLNAISMLYVALLAACILLKRRIIQKLWPVFVFLFASILVLEYFAIWKSLFPSNQHIPSETDVHCHDCWESSALFFQYCKNCWIGLIVDDPRMLISYFSVFMIACFKLRADNLSSLTGSSMYRQKMSQSKNTFVWKDLSFETKSMWTFLDYLRLYFYCHLLDLVLCLILITGTLEYDILHLGYLAFALVFFRMRLVILKKKNKVFRFLRIYNFALIVLSLAYQSPFVGVFSSGNFETIEYLYEMTGFYKYDYGFRITARSALVEIIIFMLVSLQSYMFSSSEFDYVARYLEAEQIGAIVREQEKKASWKTAQLLYIRESEEKKRQRNLQVEKMKSEMLNLQIQLHGMNSTTNCGSSSPDSGGLRKRKSTRISNRDSGSPGKGEGTLRKEEKIITDDSIFHFEVHESPSWNAEIPELIVSPKCSAEPPLCEITEIEQESTDSLLSDSGKKAKVQSKENPLISAVQLIGDGVSQSDMSSDATSLQIGRIFRHIWSQMQSNNDVVCYACFLLVFLWNFSLLSMVFLAALFLYALCVNTGPSYIFWVIMLMYTEVYILVQYVYQIIIQNCKMSIDPVLLRELGVPAHKITSSFVISSWPLFLLYLFILLQSSMSVKDGEWIPSTDIKFRRYSLQRKEVPVNYSWSDRAQDLLHLMTNMVKSKTRSIFRYLKSLIRGAESPPYFVQVSMDVTLWPADGIQPETIESGINQLLKMVHDKRCKENNINLCPFASSVHVQSIERSQENPNVALVVFEVEYASPLTSCASAEWHKSLTPAADVAKEILEAQHAGFVNEIGFPFIIVSVIGGSRREVDLYAYIFGADLSVFFLVAIFYQPVIKNKSEFLDAYQLEDQFPKEFVFILMIIFFLIVLDRIIYLCSFATGKLIFYIFNLALFTYSVTKYAWHLEHSQNAARLALRAIFLAKVVSLALQAIQIRHGIPHKSTLYRQFLTSKVSQINYLCYRLYRALPFLYELRCVLDWSCTTTSLTMYDWLKLEDIYASLYLVKCDAVLNRAQHKQGEKQTKWTKCCSGIFLFFILLCVIWAPMLIYSSGNPTNIANPIKDASVQIDIKTMGGRLTLYQNTLCEKLPWDIIDPDFDLDPHGYFDMYNKNDIQLICCQADASMLWLVPNVVQMRFIQSLDWDMDMDIIFKWVLTRDRPKGKEVVKYEKTISPPDLPKQSDIQKVLNGSANSFRTYNLYAKHLRVTGSGEVRSFEQEILTGGHSMILIHRISVAVEV